MPIPSNARYGYTNIGHYVPFIFGSLTWGGSGVFFDVKPQPIELGRLDTVPVLSNQLNSTVLLEREFEKAAQKFTCVRYAIIPAERTDGDGVGGLELSVARVTSHGLELCTEGFCADSVVRGRGVISMVGEERDLAPHDHFGIPVGVKATIHQTGNGPLVLLDAVLKPAASRF